MEPLGMRRMGEYDYADKDPDPMLLTEAEAYERYAPDTAYVVAVTDLTDATYGARMVIGNYRDDIDLTDMSIDWGDGTRTPIDTNSTTYSHSYGKLGRYVVRVPDCCTTFTVGRSGYVGIWIKYLKKVVFALRFGDHITSLYNDAQNPGVFCNCRFLNNNKWLPRWPKNLTTASKAYSSCRNISSPELPAWPTTLTDAAYAFYGCRRLTCEIPAWPTTLTKANFTFYYCIGITGAWTSDPAELMPTNITSHGDCVTGASDALRELFYSDWGGTKEETTTT